MGDITINDIAKATGVSGATVSRALNGQKGAGESQKKLILDIAEKMGYKPNTINERFTIQKRNG